MCMCVNVWVGVLFYLLHICMCWCSIHVIYSYALCSDSDRIDFSKSHQITLNRLTRITVTFSSVRFGSVDCAYSFSKTTNISLCVSAECFTVGCSMSVVCMCVYVRACVSSILMFQHQEIILHTHTHTLLIVCIERNHLRYHFMATTHEVIQYYQTICTC